MRRGVNAVWSADAFAFVILYSGWMGDAHMSSSGLMFSMDAQSFHTNFLQNINDDQVSYHIILYHIRPQNRNTPCFILSFSFLFFQFQSMFVPSLSWQIVACPRENSQKECCFLHHFHSHLVIARSRAACTILTTHSSTLAQALPLRSVRKKERNGGGGFVRPLLVSSRNDRFTKTGSGQG